MNIFKNINKYLVIYSVILSVALLAFYEHEKKLKVENLAYRQNVAVLMDSVAHYQVNDSLNASQIGELQLKLSEYEKYRKEDAELIKKLKADKLQAVIKTETKTEYEIKTELKDSIVYKDTLKTISDDTLKTISNDTLQVKIINKEDPIVYKDTLKTINYTSKWTDLHGFISGDTLQVKIINREELIFVESLQRKKFLCIKLPGWLFGYKKETLDVISRNPNTTIQDIEYVKLK